MLSIANLLAICFAPHGTDQSDSRIRYFFNTQSDRIPISMARMVQIDIDPLPCDLTENGGTNHSQSCQRASQHGSSSYSKVTIARWGHMIYPETKTSLLNIFQKRSHASLSFISTKLSALQVEFVTDIECKLALNRKGHPNS